MEYRYRGGKENTEVVLIRVEGGGHTWPGGVQYLNKMIIGGVCNDFNASEVILEFLLRQKLLPVIHLQQFPWEQ